MNSSDKKATKSRKLILKVAKKVGGSHIGGCFSIVDFILCLYESYLKNGLTVNELQSGYLKSYPKIIFSKGHCYLAQLAAIDVLSDNNLLTSQYLSSGSNYFGHPKRVIDNDNFLVSTGALGQGITFANGIALADKKNDKNEVIISIIGDGELNEGSCWEAINFAQQNALNHIFIIDNNKQMSLSESVNILAPKNIVAAIEGIGAQVISIDGHNYEVLGDICLKISRKEIGTNGPVCIILNTIKGKGVSFMEGVTKWHHRRFKDNEYEDAMKELEKNEK